jgi:hypothetical protein
MPCGLDLPLESRLHFRFNASLSNTMLVIGNTADPITSLTHAKLVNKIQPMTRLIHHDGFGVRRLPFP